MIATTISQSKHLLELGLSSEAADMYIENGIPYSKEEGYTDVENITFAWSLSVLLELMPITLGAISTRHLTDDYLLSEDKRKWKCFYSRHTYVSIGDTPIEAAYSMVIWLIEQGYIKTEKK